MLTKEEITKKVEANDTEWFAELQWGGEHKGEFKIVYDQNWGDGNDYYIGIQFTNFKGMFVLLDGTYSSWDSPHWDSVKFAQPYEYKETRYKPVTKEYLRDLALGEVLDDKE